MKTLLSLVLVSLLLTGCSGNAPTSSNNQAAEKHDDHSGHDHAEGEHHADHDDHSGHDHPEGEHSAHDDHSGHDHAEGEHPAHDDHSGHDHPEDENLPPHRH